jgi:hypothetical protein
LFGRVYGCLALLFLLKIVHHMRLMDLERPGIS